MIAFVKGILDSYSQDSVIINVHGIGYEISIPTNILTQLPTVGNSLQLYTHFHLREDQAQLFGFLEPTDKELFKLLIEVSGVGLKLALSVLSTYDKETFVHAILHENIDILVSIPGVGKKTAQRLILELKDKLSKLSTLNPSLVNKKTLENSSYLEATEALTALGYKQNDIEEVLNKVSTAENTETESLIRAVLQELGRK